MSDVIRAKEKGLASEATLAQFAGPMTEPAITPELVRQHHLTLEEYDKLKALLGRELSYTELGICSGIWSEAREPEYLKAVRAFTLASVPEAQDTVAALKTLLAWPTIASKNRGYRQHDPMVSEGSAVCPGSDAVVPRIKEDSLPGVAPAAAAPEAAAPEAARAKQEKCIALTVDYNAVYVYLDPYEGAKAAVAEAARNLACTGAVPQGITDNLNCGNPRNPEIYWQLRESLRGLAEGCRAFHAPVTGDNVSLCNQSPTGPTGPTPAVSMAGLLEKAEHLTTQGFKDEGDAIVLLGNVVDTADPLLGLGGSAYLQRLHGLKTGTPPRCDLEKEKELHLVLRGLIHSGVVKSAHGCSAGGLAVALAESCLSQPVARETPRLIGAQIDLSAAGAGVRLEALLFGETQGRIVISTSNLDAVKTVERAKLLGINAVRIGTVGGDNLGIKTAAGEFAWSLTELHDQWRNALPRPMRD